MTGHEKKKRRNKKFAAKKLQAKYVPSLPTLVKLGSIVVHADEYLSDNRHHVDLFALQALLADPDVVAWTKSMGPLLPVKR